MGTPNGFVQFSASVNLNQGYLDGSYLSTHAVIVILYGAMLLHGFNERSCQCSVQGSVHISGMDIGFLEWWG